ncbi:potassium transporter TrkG [Maricaulis sp. D1M11]|uniref:potassium transporter TrkG n=1 Tax=Maricaulis sp. D1M11 TaxID=3076117 RepID=UPI0039B3C02E
MAFPALIRPLSGFWIALGVMAALNALFAMAWNEPVMVVAFLTLSLLCVFFAGMVLLLTRGLSSRAGTSDALVLGLLVWISGPLLAALPFLSTPQFTFEQAVFEAVSAFTTTGAILHPPEALPQSLVFWRHLLAGLGGLVTLIMATALLAALDRNGPGVRRSFLLTLNPDNVFAHLPIAARRIAMVYGVMILVVAGLLILDGQTGPDALAFALSGLSTAGLMPFSGALGDDLSGFGLFVLAVASLAGALNIAIFWDALRDRRALLDPDLAALAVMVLALALVFMIVDMDHVFDRVFDAIFIVTTSGWQIHEGQIPVPVAALFAVLIGGAAASTAGGVKVSRVFLLWWRMGAELNKLMDPSGIQRVKFRGRHVADSLLITIWSYVLGFAAVLGLGGLLVALQGVSFEPAFSVTVAALSNTGPLFAQTGEGHAWSTLPKPVYHILIPVMILGRLEVLAGLAAIWALVIRR